MITKSLLCVNCRQPSFKPWQRCSRFTIYWSCYTVTLLLVQCPVWGKTKAWEVLFFKLLSTSTHSGDAGESRWLFPANAVGGLRQQLRALSWLTNKQTKKQNSVGRFIEGWQFSHICLVIGKGSYDRSTIHRASSILDINTYLFDVLGVTESGATCSSHKNPFYCRSYVQCKQCRVYVDNTGNYQNHFSCFSDG